MRRGSQRRRRRFRAPLGLRIEVHGPVSGVAGLPVWLRRGQPYSHDSFRNGWAHSHSEARAAAVARRTSQSLGKDSPGNAAGAAPAASEDVVVVWRRAGRDPGRRRIAAGAAAAGFFSDTFLTSQRHTRACGGGGDRTAEAPRGKRPRGAFAFSRRADAARRLERPRLAQNNVPSIRNEVAATLTLPRRTGRGERGRTAPASAVR
jgi:hypothetical protein